MKQITSYSNYIVIKEWTIEELEKSLTNKENEVFRKYNKICSECQHELSLIIEDTPVSIEWYLHCTYCHKEQYINFD